MTKAAHQRPCPEERQTKKIQVKIFVYIEYLKLEKLT